MSNEGTTQLWGKESLQTVKGRNLWTQPDQTQYLLPPTKLLHYSWSITENAQNDFGSLVG